MTVLHFPKASFCPPRFKIQQLTVLLPEESEITL